MEYTVLESAVCRRRDFNNLVLYIIVSLSRSRLFDFIACPRRSGHISSMGLYGEHVNGDYGHVQSPKGFGDVRYSYSLRL